eukprot:4520980-Amphidinium_carterae.1
MPDPAIDRLEPILAKERIDMELPRDANDNADSDEPKRVKLRTDKDAPGKDPGLSHSQQFTRSLYGRPDQRLACCPASVSSLPLQTTTSLQAYLRQTLMSFSLDAGCSHLSAPV